MLNALPFPADAFPCTTIIRRMGVVQNADGGFRKTTLSEVAAMGSVQDAPVDQTTSYQSRGAKVDSVIYYRTEPDARPDDEITWQEEGFVYTVIAVRQEAGFGLLWSVYCLRAR